MWWLVLLCLQVNWTPKVAKDIIKQGILPDVKVITGRRENKFVVGSFSFRGARVAQLDSARPSVREVPGDISSVIHLVPFLRSFN